MSDQFWDQLKDSCLGLNFQPKVILFSDQNRAILRADYLNSAGELSDALVQLLVDSPDGVNRLLEATFFEHPNILRHWEAGTFTHRSRPVTYAVTEVAGIRSKWALTVEEVRKCAGDVVAGLAYLHQRNLVYCILSPEAVAQTEAGWKLGDFTELRIAGDPSGEPLFLPVRVGTLPPEAAEGLLSPAWDVWSFGQTLRGMLRECRVDTGSSRRAYNRLRETVLACLNIHPSSRPSLNQLAGLLAA